MGNWEVIYDQSELLTETKNFYKNLYQQNKCEKGDFDFKKEFSYEDIPKLSKGKSNCLECELTLA